MKYDNRHTANKEIIRFLRIFIRRYPEQSVSRIIQERIIRNDARLFYEESSTTLFGIKYEPGLMVEPPTINSLIVDRLEEFVDKFPNMRFGQILSNYFFEFCDKPSLWLIQTEYFLKEN